MINLIRKLLNKILPEANDPISTIDHSIIKVKIAGTANFKNIFQSYKHSIDHPFIMKFRLLSLGKHNQ